MKHGTRLPTSDREGVIELTKNAIRESWGQGKPVKASEVWRTLKEEHPDIRKMRFRQFSTGVVLPARYAVQQEGLKDPAGRQFKAPGRPVTAQPARPVRRRARATQAATETQVAMLPTPPTEKIKRELYEMAREIIEAPDFVAQLRTLPDLLDKYGKRIGNMVAA
jgi:hypothetical protein